MWLDLLTGKPPVLAELPTGTVRTHACTDDGSEDMEEIDLAQFGLQRKMGKLTVLRMADSRNGLRWWCQCECGTTKAIKGSDLKSGKVKSCGCGQYLMRFVKTGYAQYGKPCACGCGKITERYKVVRGMTKGCARRIQLAEGKHGPA